MEHLDEEVVLEDDDLKVSVDEEKPTDTSLNASGEAEDDQVSGLSAESRGK